MFTIIDHKTMGRSETDWLDSWFHFSFANYYDPKRMGFGGLRVVNEDIISPATGILAHTDQDKEILIYVVEGELTHYDSLGQRMIVKRGEVLYRRVIKGNVYHEENRSADDVRLIQIWMTSNQIDFTPQQKTVHFPWCNRVNQWMEITDNQSGEGIILFQEDMRVLVTMLSGEHSLSYHPLKHRQLYLVCMEGEAIVNQRRMKKHDACKVRNEPLHILSKSMAHLLLFDMKTSIR